jgi:hypothetical protein
LFVPKDYVASIMEKEKRGCSGKIPEKRELKYGNED